MKKYLYLLIVSLLLFTGCSGDKEDNDYKKLMKDNDYIIVDVRTSDEFMEEHVKDAINIPYDTIDQNVKLDKNKLIFVYCKSGGRSSIAYQNLKELGYNVYDLGAFDSIDLEKE